MTIGQEKEVEKMAELHVFLEALLITKEFLDIKKNPQCFNDISPAGFV